jgi:hypothetical protein
MVMQLELDALGSSIRSVQAQLTELEKVKEGKPVDTSTKWYLEVVA